MVVILLLHVAAGSSPVGRLLDWRSIWTLLRSPAEPCNLEQATLPLGTTYHPPQSRTHPVLLTHHLSPLLLGLTALACLSRAASAQEPASLPLLPHWPPAGKAPVQPPAHSNGLKTTLLNEPAGASALGSQPSCQCPADQFNPHVLWAPISPRPPTSSWTLSL